MKINKILAAGVAATLAVTSLSAVASAEIKSIEFPMDYTVSNVAWKSVPVQWLDDNDYIGGTGVDAAKTCRQLIADYVGAAATNVLNTKIIAWDGTGVATAYTTGHAAKKTVVDDKNGAKGTISEYVFGAAGAGSIDAGGVIADKYVDDVMKSYAKTFDDAVTVIIAAMKAINTNKNKEEDVYSAVKLLGDLKTVSKKLLDARDILEAINNKLGDDDIAGIDNAIDDYEAAMKEVDTIIRLAEDALLGAPLLEDKELGGIWLSDAVTKMTDGKAAVGDKAIKITGAKLTLKGTKRGTTTNESWNGDFVIAYDDFKNHIGNDEKDKNGNYIHRKGYYLAFGPRYVNRQGYINLNVFGALTGAEIDVDYELYIVDSVDAAGNITGSHKAAYYTEKEYNDNKKILKENLRKWGIIKYIDKFGVILDDFDLKSTDGDWVNDEDYNKLPNLTTSLYKLYRALYNSVPFGEIEDNSGTKVTKYAFVNKTQDNGQIIYRDNVWVMSQTGANKSQNQVNKYDGNQTYYDSGLGTNPNEFGGLASQTADFFNKQNNGQIIMHFIDPAKVTLWTSNGIPSTEVGLRTALAQTAIALFFNYEESTGSIQTIGTVDKDALTVTFDMEDVLADFGGLTKANLHDIYYGCNNGLSYGDPYWATGFAVDKVTLQYDDAPAAVDAQTADDDAADDDAAVVVADDDDDDDVVADDDDDDIAEDDDIIEDDDDDDDDAGEIIADDDDDDDDVNNDVDYVDADDDANPGTGVGLAVIPAIVAGAALVVSKKRK